MNGFDWGLLSLLPLVATLILAFLTRSALIAMAMGAFVGTLMLGLPPGTALGVRVALTSRAGTGAYDMSKFAVRAIAGALRQELRPDILFDDFESETYEKWEVEGTAFISGRHEFVIDPADPQAEGFILR